MTPERDTSILIARGEGRSGASAWQPIDTWLVILATLVAVLELCRA